MSWIRRKAKDAAAAPTAAAQLQRDWGDQLAAQATRTAGDAARFAAEFNIGGANAEYAPEELAQLAEVLANAGRELNAAAERLRPRRRAGPIKVVSSGGGR